MQNAEIDELKVSIFYILIGKEKNRFVSKIDHQRGKKITSLFISFAKPTGQFSTIVRRFSIFGNFLKHYHEPINLYRVVRGVGYHLGKSWDTFS